MNAIIGHQKNLRWILDLVQAGRFPQSSLWYGQAGSGKKMVARHVAQILLGAEKQQLDNHPDFFLLTPTAAKSATDKAAKTGAVGSIKIEQILELKRRLMYPPLQSARQVIVIDDAELMTTPTANSLLKILEEPRPHQIFILVTGQFHRMLMTIRSRAARFYFPPLSAPELREVLQRQDESLAGGDAATLEFFLSAFSGSPAHVLRAAASGLNLTDLQAALSRPGGFADVTARAKRLLQKDVDVPVFLQALRVWQLQNVRQKGGATYQDIEKLESLAAAEARFAKHIQSEFVLENLFL
jgi:replication-associated recombination protein RarA